MCLILGWSACFIDLNRSIDPLVNYDEFKMVWGSSVVEFLGSQQLARSISMIENWYHNASGLEGILNIGSIFNPLRKMLTTLFLSCTFVYRRFQNQCRTSEPPPSIYIFI